MNELFRKISSSSMGLLHYPRGIINPNYPGFQHLAHTLAEHFIDQEFDQSSDSEISDDCNFDSSPREHLCGMDIISDDNNNDNGRTEHNIDLNSNESSRNHTSPPRMFSNPFNTGKKKFLEKSETNVFCKSAELDSHDFNNFTENLEGYSNEMDFNEDDDLDYVASDENIDSDSEAYVKYDDCNMSISELHIRKIENIDEHFQTEHNFVKSLTPDILIEHKSCKTPLKKATTTAEIGSDVENIVSNEISRSTANVSFLKDKREYEPDLIKYIIHDYDHGKLEAPTILDETLRDSGDIELVRNTIEGISVNTKIINNGAEKISHSIPTEKGNESDNGKSQKIKHSLPLSFESSTSSTVDIIGDFGKEIEKEISLIVSGFRDTTNEICSIESLADVSKAIREVKSRQNSTTSDEFILDEDKFMEHLKSFSRMCDASLSNIGEKIVVKHTLVNEELEVQQLSNESSKQKHFIPTAIVKPKYQKLSYDERQLPVCGATITETPRKVQKHLPNLQKSFSKRTYNLKNKIGASVDRDGREKGNEECGVTVNSIAIVQPLKNVTAPCLHINMNDGTNNNKNKTGFGYEENISNILIKNAMDETNAKKKIPVKMTANRISDAFDVYNIETALPLIDLKTIETHLKAAQEKEQIRKNDREVIRRRLAMGEEDDYLSSLTSTRAIRKPGNLQSRLQKGRNLQICFMNEVASDSDSSDSETCPKLSQGINRKKSSHRSSSLLSQRSASLITNPYSSRPLSISKKVMKSAVKVESPVTVTLGQPNDNNFFTQQARLQIEARMALSQAKDMAHMQMEIERQKQGYCPITELVHQTLSKVRVDVPSAKRRLSRQMLTGMNIAQLQIIINEFHTYIETLNSTLVNFLMDRDDLSMRQDSMLIDIEDVTRYLAEKEEIQLKNDITKPRENITKSQSVDIMNTTKPGGPEKNVMSQKKIIEKPFKINCSGHLKRTSISLEAIEKNGVYL